MILALDSETTGLDLWHGARPFFVTVCRAGGRQEWWQWPVDPLTRKVRADPADLREIAAMILGADQLILQNAKFDAAALGLLFADHGIAFAWPWERTVDTLIAGHLLASNQPHDLTSMTLLWLGKDISPFEERLKTACLAARRHAKKHHPDWRTAKKGLPEMPSAKGSDKAGERRGKESSGPWKADAWLPGQLREEDGSLPAEWSTVLRDYSNADSAATFALWPVLEAEIEKRKLGRIFAERMRLPAIAAGMEAGGVTISAAVLERMRQEFMDDIGANGRRCREIARGFGFELELPAGSSVNGSLMEFCFGKDLLALPPAAWTPGRKPSLSKAAVDVWLDELDPDGAQMEFVRCLAAKRKCDTAVSYLDGYERFWLPLENGHENQDASEDAEQGGGQGRDRPGAGRRRAGGDVARPPARPRCDGIGGRAAGAGKLGLGSGAAGVGGRLAAEPRGDWRLLHPGVNPTGSGTLRWSHSNPNSSNVCFDPETEFLTTDGWVFANDLTEEHLIAEYWPEDGRIDFVKPIEVMNPVFKGMMQHITTHQQIDLLLTPKHRCLLQDRKTGAKFDVIAEDFREDARHMHAGEYVGGSVSYSQAEVSWLCAVQADGHYCKTDGVEYGLRFIFVKKRKSDRLRGIMQELGCKFSEDRKEDKIGFYVGKNEPAVQLAKRLMPLKTLGPWLLDCDAQTLHRFADELFLWDGDSVRKARWSSSDLASADWAQAIWCLTGRRACMSSKMPKGWAKRVHHYIGVGSKPYSMTTNFSREQIPWNGRVYCVAVPSGYVMVRRNGKVSISGNSKLEGRNLRACFGPAPGREWWSFDGKNLELRIPAYEAGETELIWVFDHPDDPPYFGSYHLVVFDLLHPEMFREHGKECKTLFESTWYQWVKNGNFCVPMDAEALTSTGWKGYEDVEIGDKVAGYDDGVLVWTPVLEKMRYEDSPLMRVWNNHFSATTTPNHRWLGKRRTGRIVKCEVEECFSSAAIKAEHTIYLSANMRDECQLPITPVEAAIIGFVCSDGSIERSPISRGYAPSQAGGAKAKFQVLMHQSKKRGIDYVDGLLAAWGKPFKKFVCKSKTCVTGEITKWKLDADAARALWRRAGLYESGTKKFDADFEGFVLKLGTDCRGSFLQAIFEAEGTTDPTGKKIYAQNEGPFAAAIKLAVFLCGDFPTIQRSKDAHCINIRASKPHVTGQRICKEDAGRGPVWCLRTGLGTWVMRQGDQTMLTGNSVVYGAQEETADRAYHVPGAYRAVKDRFPKIAALGAKQMQLANKRGWVETIPDRSVDPERGYPLLCTRSERGDVVPTTPLNYHVSGTAMWWTARAMVETERVQDGWRQKDRGGWSGRLILQVHDELVFDFPRAADPRIDPKRSNLPRARAIRRAMESCGDGIGVPTPVSMEWHPVSWAEGFAVD